MQNLKFLLPFMLISITIFKLVLCSPNWYKSRKGIKYLIEGDLKYTWYEASNECARRDLQLAAITKEEIQLDLNQLLTKVFGKSRDLWIGGNDGYNKTKSAIRPFYWSSTGEEFKYYYWAIGEPDNDRGVEYCVYIWEQDGFRWNDSFCERKCGYICTEKLSIKCLELVDEIVENCQVL